MQRHKRGWDTQIIVSVWFGLGIEINKQVKERNRKGKGTWKEKWKKNERKRKTVLFFFFFLKETSEICLWFWESFNEDKAATPYQPIQPDEFRATAQWPWP